LKTDLANNVDGDMGVDGDEMEGKKHSQLKAIERLNKTLKQEKDNLLKVVFMELGMVIDYYILAKLIFNFILFMTILLFYFYSMKYVDCVVLSVLRVCHISLWSTI